VAYIRTIRRVNAAKIQTECLALDFALSDHLFDQSRVRDLGGVRTNAHNAEVVEGACLCDAKLLSFDGRCYENSQFGSAPMNSTRLTAANDVICIKRALHISLAVIDFKRCVGVVGRCRQGRVVSDENQLDLFLFLVEIRRTIPRSHRTLDLPRSNKRDQPRVP
jgi:hypothetical protein